MHTATLPGVTASHTYEDDMILTPHTVQRGFMKVPEGPGLGVELDEELLAAAQHEPRDLPAAHPLREDGSVAYAV